MAWRWRGCCGRGVCLAPGYSWMLGNVNEKFAARTATATTEGCSLQQPGPAHSACMCTAAGVNTDRNCMLNTAIGTGECTAAGTDADIDCMTAFDTSLGGFRGVRALRCEATPPTTTHSSFTQSN
eukprot:6644342-Alexandrium_andersonii.AAC.1